MPTSDFLLAERQDKTKYALPTEIKISILKESLHHHTSETYVQGEKKPGSLAYKGGFTVVTLKQIPARSVLIIEQIALLLHQISSDKLVTSLLHVDLLLYCVFSFIASNIRCSIFLAHDVKINSVLGQI